MTRSARARARASIRARVYSHARSRSTCVRPLTLRLPRATMPNHRIRRIRKTDRSAAGISARSLHPLSCACALDAWMCGCAARRRIGCIHERCSRVNEANQNHRSERRVSLDSGPVDFTPRAVDKGSADFRRVHFQAIGRWRRRFTRVGIQACRFLRHAGFDRSETRARQFYTG